MFSIVPGLKPLSCCKPLTIAIIAIPLSPPFRTMNALASAIKELGSILPTALATPLIA